MESRKYELIIWGCTGFTGKWALHHIAKQYGAPSQTMRYAIAGRDIEKLKACKTEMCQIIGDPEATIDMISASVTDFESLKAMTSQTAVIATFAGPFTTFGEPLVRACVETKTHYVDSTGELHWVKQMASKYSIAAEEAGIKIVPCCGFDFVPAEMMLDEISKAIKQKAGDLGGMNRFDQQYWASSSGFSAGTARSGYALLSKLKFSEAFLGMRNGFKQMKNKFTTPFYLRIESDYRLVFPYFNNEAKKYTVPFVMSTPIINYLSWSNEMQHFKYGTHYIWSAGLGMESMVKSYIAAFLTLLMEFTLIIMSRFAFTANWLPKSGTGPNLETRDHSYSATVFGYAPSRSVPKDRSKDICFRYQWTYSKGEAYMFTGMAVVEAGLTIAKASDKCEKVNGVGTPAMCLGSEYLSRMRTCGLQTSDVQHVPRR